MSVFRAYSQLIVFTAGAIVLPLVNQSLNLSLFIFLFILMGWASSWDILGGWTGQTSLGHAAFVGIGAYSVALLSGKYGFDAVSASQIGMILAALLALAWGLMSLKLRGSYFALSSIAIAEILRLVAINEAWLTDGAQGVFLFSLPQPFGLNLFDRLTQYYLALAYVVLVLAIISYFSRSRFGFHMQALKTNVFAAQAAGINPLNVKLRAFIWSAALTALGGALYGIFLSFISPHELFSLPLSIQIALTAIIGGRGTVWGPSLGAILLVSASELFSNSFAEASLLIYGILIIFVILYLPQGILGKLTLSLNQAKQKRLTKAKAKLP